MRKTLPDPQFNKLLDDEVRRVAAFYQDNVHYEPHEYMRVWGDGRSGLPSSRTVPVQPGDRDLVAFMRKAGGKLAIDQEAFEPLAIFVIQAAFGHRLDEPGATPQRVFTVYGITNDARFNLGVLMVQYDEDDRLYAVVTDVFHWEEEPRKFTLDVLPYLEFFRVNDEVRASIPVS